MAGSRDIFQYTNDAGVLYAVEVDESNAEATAGGTQLMSRPTVALPGLPRRSQMRYVNCQLTSNPDIRRRFWIGNSAAVQQVLVGATFNAVVYPVSGDTGGTTEPWTIRSYRGEKFPANFNPSANDTGLTDGDFQ